MFARFLDYRQPGLVVRGHCRRSAAGGPRCNLADGVGSHDRQQLFTQQLLAKHDLSLGRRSVELKDLLGPVGVSETLCI